MLWLMVIAMRAIQLNDVLSGDLGLTHWITRIWKISWRGCTPWHLPSSHFQYNYKMAPSIELLAMWMLNTIWNELQLSVSEHHLFRVFCPDRLTIVTSDMDRQRLPMERTLKREDIYRKYDKLQYFLSWSFHLPQKRDRAYIFIFNHD